VTAAYLEGLLMMSADEFERLTKALNEVVRDSAVGEWLKTPNPAFSGLTPLEMIDRGEGDRLWEMIYYLRSGVAS
jgi:hypothetical protein